MTPATHITPADRSRIQLEQQYMRMGTAFRESLGHLETVLIHARRTWTGPHEYKETLERLHQEVGALYTAVDSEYAAEFGASLGTLKQQTRYATGRIATEEQQ